MNETVYSVWCEWDIGQEGLVFLTTEGAWEWATKALVDVGIEDDVDELYENGLIGINDLEVRS